MRSQTRPKSKMNRGQVKKKRKDNNKLDPLTGMRKGIERRQTEGEMH